MPEILAGLIIPDDELEYRATRSGGPGGQHVNTSATRVELTWNVNASRALDDAQRTLIMTRLTNRIDAEGILRLTASTSRSQHQNRVEVTERFVRLIANALHVPRPRRKTRPSRAAKQARLRQKKRRSEVKKRRGPVRDEE